MVVSRGTDQGAISSAYDKRDLNDVVRNFGDLLVSLSGVVPDGIICFFTSYAYMERTIAEWDRKGVITALLKRKLVFIETKDIVETTIALDNYRKACDCGRGAIFFSIARGKVAEGIDFNNHYGRCVVMMGVPYQYTKSKVLLARLDYLRTRHDIHENDFLTFDAIRQTSQCIGRVIRSKTDYGLIVLADERYAKPSKRNKLPPWVQNFLQTGTTNISTDIACSLARNFLIESSQPLTDDEINVSLLDKAKLDKKHLEWMKQNPGSAAARQAFQLHERVKLKKQRELQQSADNAHIEAHRKQIAKFGGQDGGENGNDEFIDDIEAMQERLEREREIQFQRMLMDTEAEESTAAAGKESVLFDWNTPVVISEDFMSLREIKEKVKAGLHRRERDTTKSGGGIDASVNPAPRKRGRFE